MKRLMLAAVVLFVCSNTYADYKASDFTGDFLLARGSLEYCKRTLKVNEDRDGTVRLREFEIRGGVTYVYPFKTFFYVNSGAKAERYGIFDYLLDWKNVFIRDNALVDVHKTVNLITRQEKCRVETKWVDTGHGIFIFSKNRKCDLNEKFNCIYKRKAGK